MKNKDRHIEGSTGETGNPSWSVCRQDDNGNVFMVKSGLVEAEALRLVAEYEAKGHKQTYWAKERK
jgi:hypothetical protein